MAEAVQERSAPYPTKGKIPPRRDPKTVHGRNEQGIAICGAKRSQGKPPCGSMLIDGENGRCKRHGGFVHKRGVEHQSYVNGRSSKYVLPQAIQGSYERFLGQPNPTSMLNELAIMDVFIENAMANINSHGIDPQMMQFLHNQFLGMEACIRHQDLDVSPEFMACFTKAYRKLQAGMDNRAVEGEVMAKMEARGRIASVENRRAEAEAKAVTQKDMLVVVMNLLTIVMAVVGREATKEIGRRMGVMLPAAVLAHSGQILDNAVQSASMSNDDESEEEDG